MSFRALPPGLTEPPRPDPVCAVIARPTVAQALSDLSEACKRKVVMAEIRLDHVMDTSSLGEFVKASTVPLVATVRRKSDGGGWEGSEEDRLALLAKAVAAGFAWVDVEWDIVASLARFGHEKRIVSYHDFAGVPGNLEDIYQAMAAADADTVKVACMTRTPVEAARVLRLLVNAPKPTIAFGMGEVGQASRVIQLKLGAPFTYAAMSAEAAPAPGMLTVSQLQLNFGVRRVNAKTRLLGVVGDPLGHSLSPIVHNNALRKLGSNDLYVPFTVPKGMLGKFLSSHSFLGIKGLSVTIPHKEEACALATRRSAEVESTGSANTLVFQEDGSIDAHNTDYDAVLDSILGGLKNHPGGWSLKGKRVLVLGAGGVARSVVHGLSSRGSEVRLAARTRERAESIASAIPCEVVDWDKRHGEPADVVVNCTPVGMHPNAEESPLEGSFIAPPMVVMDTIYNPDATLLVRQAREKGAVAVTGLDMFIAQAAAQFKLFTGEEPPVDLMRQVARNALSARLGKPGAKAAH